jgi:serine phosphatase RsbU (regulator of sigma subunit)
MDMSICRFGYTEGKNEVVVTFAGAKASIFYVQHLRVQELRGDKKSIGGMQRDEDRAFNNCRFVMRRGDLVYMTTDGFFDQHNEMRQKFGKQMFKETLEIVSEHHLDKQRKMMEEALVKHQGKQAQRDDITVIGLRL